MTGWPSHAAGMSEYPRIIAVGDTALSVEFGNAISPALHTAVCALEAALLAQDLPGLRETVPSFRSLLGERMEVIAPPDHYDKVDF